VDTIANPITATIRVLERAPHVMEILGSTGRIAGGEIPKRWVESMPRPGIVVVPAGGGEKPGARDRVPAKVPRIDVRCYHSTPEKAHTLALAVEYELQQWNYGRAGGVLVHWFNHVNGPVQYRTDPGDWPVAVSTFRMQYATVA